MLEPVDPLQSCQEAMDELQQSDFLVLEDGRLVGVVEGERWKKSIRELGPSVPVSRIMRRQFVCFSPASDMAQVWRDVLRMEQTLFPVMDEDRVLGVVAHDDLRRALTLTRMQNRMLQPAGAAKPSIRTIDLG